jgi:hypothetical protein
VIPLAIIRVPLDKTTIQEGVHAAQPGDVVLVLKGIYKETVIVTSSFIRITAEDKNEAILHGSGLLSNGFLLDNVTDVEISGFKIQNYLLNGIFVSSGGFHRLLENSCVSNGLNGIGLAVGGNFVWKNILRRNSYAGVLISADNNWLLDNLVTGNGTDGVSIFSGTHNALIGNKVLRSVGGSGVSVLGQDTLLYENELKGNLQGIVVYNPTKFINSGVADNNEVYRNKLANIVLLSDTDTSMGNKTVHYMKFANTLAEMAQQTTGHIPERRRISQEMSITAFKKWLERHQPHM